MRRHRSRSRAPRIQGLSVILGRDDASLEGDLDDCPICRRIRDEGIPMAAFDFQGRMLGIEKFSPHPVVLPLDLEDGTPPIEISLPDTSTYRDLLTMLAGFVVPELLEEPPIAAGVLVSLDERVAAGKLVRLRERRH